MARSRLNRRVAKTDAYSVSETAMTIREAVFVRLVMETVKYLDMKNLPFGADPSPQEKVQRGIVRGIAVAMTKMYGNPYQEDSEVRAAERRAVSIAKEWINDGRVQGKGWWLRRRRDFWRSKADAAGVGA